MPFHGGIIRLNDAILDIISQIPRGYSTSLSNVTLGSNQINDQMRSIAWGALGGLPGVGIYATIMGTGLGQNPDWRASALTMGVTSAALYYFLPRTATAVMEFTGMMFLYGIGMHPERAWAPPPWIYLAIAYGYYHSITKEPGAKGTVGMTIGAVPPSQHRGGPVWEHLERTHG